MNVKVYLRGFSSILAAAAVLLSQPALASVTIPTEAQRREEARAAIKDWLFETSAQGHAPRFDDFLLNEHQTFASRADAIRWASSFVASFQKSFRDPDLKILKDDPRYQILDGYVQELWTAFTTLFPAQTAGLNSPPVILLDSKVSNAFVRQSADGKQMGHAIFVLTGLLDQFSSGGRLNKDLVTSVIGHELAHSVFLHGLSKYQKRVNHFYNRSKVAFGYLSSQSADTAALDESMKGWLAGALLAGELTTDDLRGLPSPGVGRSIMMGAFKQMQTDSINANCTAGKDAYNAWKGFIRFSALKNAIEIAPRNSRPPDNAGAPATIAQASENLSTQDRACVGDAKFSLVELASKAFGIAPETLRSSEMFMKFERTLATAPDAITGFQKVVAPIREDMKQIESSVDFSQMGYYTFEEHADEVSALLHTYLNRKADALGSAFMVFLKESSDDDAAACANMVSSQTEPPNGSFSDPHRSLCYRVYHLKKFSSAIGSDVKGFASRFIDISIGMSSINQPGLTGNATPRLH